MFERKIEQLEKVLVRAADSLSGEAENVVDIGQDGSPDWDSLPSIFSGLATAAVILADSLYADITGKKPDQEYETVTGYRPKFSERARTPLGFAVAMACEGMVVGLTLGEDYGGPFYPDVLDRKSFICQTFELSVMDREAYYNQGQVTIGQDGAKVLATLVKSGWINENDITYPETLDAVSRALEGGSALENTAVTPGNPENLQERWARLAGILIKESK